MFKRIFRPFLSFLLAVFGDRMATKNKAPQSLTEVDRSELFWSDPDNKAKKPGTYVRD